MTPVIGIGTVVEGENGEVLNVSRIRGGERYDNSGNRSVYPILHLSTPGHSDTIIDGRILESSFLLCST